MDESKVLRVVGMLSWRLGSTPGNAIRSALWLCAGGEAVCLWLSEYDNPNTISAFRKEAERFLLWAASRQQKLADIAREDIRDFKDFLKKPEPRALWCGKRVAKTLPDGTLNPEWKPFLASCGLEQFTPFLFSISAPTSNGGSLLHQSSDVLNTLTCFEYIAQSDSAVIRCGYVSFQ